MTSSDEPLSIEFVFDQCRRLGAPATLFVRPDICTFRVDHPKRPGLYAEGSGATPFEAVVAALDQMDLQKQTQDVELEWIKKKLKEAEDEDDAAETQG